MESDMSWEQNAVINELIQGMEIARKLKADLRLPTSVDTRNLLVQRILSSYDKALLILRWNESIPESQIMQQEHKTWSPLSINRSPPREEVQGGLKDHQKLKPNSKKRKIVPKWMDQVRVKVENGFEGPHEDGYKWRKYGQKDILSAKYPRCYYRCTYRNSKGCWATKQVQRSDEDPTMLDITYRGKHTCSQGNNAVPPPKSPDIQEKPHGYNTESLTKFRNMLTVNTENLGNEEKAFPFPSPSTSFGCMTQDNNTLFLSVLENDPFLLSQESKSFQSQAFLFDELDGVCTKPCPLSDITEIISANTLATDFPILDFNFYLDAVKID